jgi:hypothetical protein
MVEEPLMAQITEDPSQSLARVREQVSQLMDAARAVMRQAESLASTIDDLAPGQAHSQRLPERAKVRIIGQVPDAPEVTGRTGVALAGGPSEAGWTYTVLVDGLEETYVRPVSVLHYLGETVPADQLYGGESLRVSVNKSGAGTIVKRRSFKRAARK